MAIHVLSGTTTTTVLADINSDTWVVPAGAGVYSTNGILTHSTTPVHSYINILVSGSVVGSISAVDLGTSTSNQVDIAATGILDGNIYAFHNSGNNLMFSNAGLLSSGYRGVSVSGLGNNLVNSGTIMASNYGVYDSHGTPAATGSGMRLTNTGLISGSGGVWTDGGKSSIDNSGEISGHHSSGIRAAAGGNSITNSGTVDGGVQGNGVLMSGSDNVLTNTGTISTSSSTKAAVQFSTATTQTGKFVNGASGSVFSGYSVAVQGAYGDETIVNHGLIDGTIDTGNGSDVIRVLGGTVNGDILAGGGDDRIVLKNATISGSVDGGTGNDTYVTDDSSVSISETSGSGTDKVISSVSYSLAGGIENLLLTGANDIDGHGNGLDNSITGNSGANLLVGHNGDDFIGGGNGDDMLRGNTGNDQLYGDYGNDTLKGGLGDDLLVDGGGDNRLFAGDGNDIIRLVEGANTVSGGKGSDWVDYRFAAIAVKIDLAAQANNDGAAQGSKFTSIETFSGTAFKDVFNGNNAANAFIGGDGNDALNGKGGADTLWGGNGADVLTGGGGHDIFLFKAASESAPGSRDTIKDFTQGVDSIDLSVIDADSSTAGNQAFTFIGHAGFHNTAGELRDFVNGSNTIVQADVDGDGAADVAILLTGTINLTASDFVL